MARPPSHREDASDDPSWDRDDDQSPMPVGGDDDDESQEGDGPGAHDAHLADDHEPDLSDCAGCGKRILAQATRCHHCGAHFVGEAWQQHIAGASSPASRWIIGTTVVLLAVMLAGLLLWGRW